MIEQRPVTLGPDSAPTDITAPLILDLLEWLAPRPRPYDEVMEAWRTSCPRLTVWEDAIDGRYVARNRVDRNVMIEVTPQGRRLLDAAGRPHRH